MMMKQVAAMRYPLLLLIAGTLHLQSTAQVNITGGSTVSENFNSMTATATATLPSGWKVDNPATVRTVGTYSAAAPATTALGGANMSATAGNGIYNFGAGTTSTGTSDRAVGGLSSGTASRSVNVYVDLLNPGTAAIQSLTLSYGVEKYRNGSNPAGFSVQLYYSTNGSTWTSAGSDFLVSFAGTADNSGFSTAPGATQSAAAKLLPVTIAAGAHLYLAWNYSVSSGTTTTNAQALGIDDVQITAVSAAPSANADLSSLFLSSGTLLPAFASSTTSYTASVPNSVVSITLTAAASDAGASIAVGGDPVASGSASSPIALSLGDNVINTVVTAANGTTKTYTVTVTRAAAPIPTLSATALASFGNVCLNTASGPNSFTLNGNELDGSPVILSALPGFEFSETAAGPYSSTLSFSPGAGFSNKAIYVRFTPSAVQSYDGPIGISGGGAPAVSISASGSGINTLPTVTTGGASSVTGSSATLSGTITAAGCGTLTAYGIEYSTVNNFAEGSGTRVPSSNLGGSSFTSALSGLTFNTTYFYKAFATTSAGTSYGSQQTVLTSAVPVVMASRENLTYKEDFATVSTWSNGFSGSANASHFAGLPISATGSIPSPARITTTSTSFSSGSSGGVQKGTGNIVLLSTGATDNTSSTAFDLYLDFTGVNAGTLSFDWASVANSTGDRNGSLLVYASTDGLSFTQIASVLNVTNNVAGSGTVNVGLPASFNNNATARLRFYYYNGTGGTGGSRPKISIDNLAVSAISTTPCVTPSAQPTALTFGTITETSIQGSFTAATPEPNKYLVIASQNNSLTSGPVDGQVYEAGDNVGDGEVVAYSSNTAFTATDLSGGSTYMFFVFAVNNACAGGPKYLATDPLQGDATTITPLPACAPPATQPTGLSLTAKTTSIAGSFTATAADEYLVLRTTDAALTALPANGQTYNAGAVIGNAVVVSRGNGTAFNATGLSPNTPYYFFVFAIGSQNCLNGPAYNTTGPLSETVATLPLSPCTTPVSQPTNLSLNAGNTTITGSFNGSVTADNYVVIASTATTLTALPADGIDYAVGDALGGGKIVASGSATSFVASGLSAATTYHLFVFAANKTCTGGTKYLTTAPLTGMVMTTATPAYTVYFGNLHAHSDYSDGNKDHPGYKPADDYKYAMTAECMDFLGISEHNHFSSPDNPGNLITNYHQGAVQADTFSAAHPNFLALYGMEWGVISGGGHVVIYGDGMNKLFGWESNVGGLSGNNYDVFVAKSDYTGANGLFKTVNDYIGQNTFATLAHPNNTDYNNLSNAPYNAVADEAIVGSAVESGPATSTNTTYSNPASPMAYLWYFNKMLSLGYHLGPVMDHDNHNTTFGKTTRARTAVLAPSLTKTEIIKAMREMRFYATEDCDAKVDFTVNTRVMGSVFSDRNAPSISVRLSDATTPTASAKIRILFGVPGSGVLPVAIDSAIGSSFDLVDNNLPVNSTGYYYAEITNAGARIVTSPVWYTRTCGYETDTVAKACQRFDWYGTTYTSSVTTSRHFTTAAGCDSVVTLHLSIYAPNTGDTAAKVCEQFTWYGSTYTSSGDYVHVLQNEGGCDSTVTLHLTIYPKPDATVTASGPATFCPGGSVTLSAPPAVSYQWSTGAITPSITVTTSGDYTVSITDANGCSNTSSASTVSVEDHTPPVPNSNALPDLTGECTVSVTTYPTATDACSGTVTATTTDPLRYNQQGIYTITWSYHDGHGNAATQTQKVIVKDGTKPVITACPTVPVLCYSQSGSYTIPAITATDNCGTVQYHYTISGATTRSGSTSDASGTFNAGLSTIHWTVDDGNGNQSTCTTTVRVNNPVTATVPDVYAVSPGGEANTIYLGYGPTSLTLNAVVSGGTPPYSCRWTAGSPSGQVVGSNPSVAVNPTATTTYYLNVRDAYGCLATTATKTINVQDVRCGQKLDKVTVCVLQKGAYTTNCVSANSVANQLSNGGYLGACTPAASKTMNVRAAGRLENAKEFTPDALSVSVLPNPSAGSFLFRITSRKAVPVSLRVLNGSGMLMETRTGIAINTDVRIGAAYTPGVYYAEIAQGGERVTIKMVKSSD